jgi:formylglycine-generating enzyme required for sulfatase activity
VKKPASVSRPSSHARISQFASWTVASLLCLAILQSASDKPGVDNALLELFQSEENITNSLGMVMVWVPAGYRVAQFEVTQTEFEKVMSSNPSQFKGPRRPVERVTWTQAQEFCRKLTESERAKDMLPDGYSYALPTQEQWRYFVGDADLPNAITSHLGDRRQTENVGSLQPNEFGLYDVRGNVWEWCSEPVARGGSWRSHEDFLDVDFRYVGTPTTAFDDIGFRVILQPAPK